jgi:hypothetical protein
VKTIALGVAGLAMIGGVAGTQPVAGMTVANIGETQAAPDSGNVTEVQWRPHYWHRYNVYGPSPRHSPSCTAYFVAIDWRFCALLSARRS